LCADNQNGIVGSFLQISGGFRCMAGARIRAGVVPGICGSTSALSKELIAWPRHLGSAVDVAA
jgi:hypothetical protein